MRIYLLEQQSQLYSLVRNEPFGTANPPKLADSQDRRVSIFIPPEPDDDNNDGFRAITMVYTSPL